MAKKGILYYYYYKDGKPVLYDSQVYRGSVLKPQFKGTSYAEMLFRYEAFTGEAMMHSTQPEMDNWKMV